MFEALKWPNFCVNVYLLKSGHFVSRQWSSISHLFWKMNFNPCRFRLDCNFKSKFEIYILLISFVNLRELISYRIGGFCKLLPFPVKAFAVFCPLPMHYNKTKYFASWECIRQCLMYSYFFLNVEDLLCIFAFLNHVVIGSVVVLLHRWFCSLNF